MTKEMEFAKCIALLHKVVRMELITEEEYTIARILLMRQLTEQRLISEPDFRK